MGVKATKEAIDLGIVTTNGDEMLRFYRDVLGFEHEGDISMEKVGIKVMHRLWFERSLIKLVVPVDAPANAATPGGLPTSTGIRYWTLSVSNLDEVLADVKAAGYPIVWPRREVRPGVSVGMVEDPDGNWVEFVEAAS
jgi:catechol 2,3-dioxygenase-like lactoylglutathione lyase family enzyme